MRIDIDFQGGSHGNFLEFACNKLIGVSVGLPFNSFGASHKKQYSGEKLFFTDHYSFWSKASFQSTKIISIQIDIDDLLPLQQISLLRAGPGGGGYGYDNEFLEIDTYNKLNNSDYRWVLEQLMTGFFKNQIKESGMYHPIILFCEEKNLYPEPEDHSPDSWKANCPSGRQHHIMISTSSPSSHCWGCGYCKKKGGLEELKQWVEKK
jgi:hypothetical protein